MGQHSEMQTGETDSSQPSAVGSRPRPHAFTITQAIAVFVSGLGIGWLVGLSASPVVSGVIASLLGVAAGVVTTFRGASASSAKSFITDARPVAILVVGVALGATVGVTVRTHDLLSPPAKLEQAAQSTVSKDNLISRSVLFAQPGSDECAELLSLEPKYIRLGFKSSSSEGIRRLGEIIEDTELLQDIAEAICAE
jgi:hypothetical protein